MAAAVPYLLDTNTASFVIRGSNPHLLHALQAHAVSSVAISTITEAELLYGLARKPGATSLTKAVHSFLRHVKALTWDSEAAARYGVLRAHLEAAGTPLGGMDTLIAAHALATGATLVTNDRAFGRVPDLIIEDWTSPAPRRRRRK